MTQQTPDQFLLGGGGTSAKFPEPGATISGTITQPPQVRQQTDMDTGKPLTWENGDPRMQLVVQLQTTERDDTDDDGLRNLYVKGSKDPASESMHAAVAGAVQAAGAAGLHVGGTLTVKYIGDGVAKTRGFTAPKRYAARYVPPADDFLAAAAPAAAPAAADPWDEPTPAAAAPAAAGPTPAQLAAVKAAGLDPAVIFPGYQPDQPPW